MGFIETLATAYLKQRSERQRATRILLPQYQYGREYVTPADYQAQVSAYKSWVYVCGNKNATNVAQQTLRLYATKRKGQKLIVPSKAVTRETLKYLHENAGLQEYLRKGDEVEEILEHPWHDLMRHVNPFLNRFALWELTDLYMELCGNCYWYIVDGPMGVPVEIWILPAPNMKIVPDPKEFIKGYVYTQGTVNEPYEEREVIHFKFPSPTNSYYGYSPLAAVASAYNINENMNTFENALFTNMARPDGVLVTEQALDDATFERLKQEWKDTYGGAHQAGKTALLDKGLQYKNISFTPRELSFLSGRKVARDEIAAAYGVPISKITTDDVNRANAEAGNYSYMNDTILPRCRRIEEKTNEKLMPRYADNLFVAFDNPVPEDKEFRLKEREANLRSYYSSVNQERQKDGQEPVPWGEKPLVQFGIAPLGSKPLEGDDIDLEDDDEAVEEGYNRKDEEARIKKWWKFAKDTEPWEARFRKALGMLFKVQEAEVLANMVRDPKGKVDDWMFNKKMWMQRFAKVGRPLHTSIIAEAGKQAIDELPKKALKSFDILDPKVLAFLKSKLFKFSFETNATTEQQIRDTLAAGVQAGETMAQLTQRVREVFGFTDLYRNERIARTEVIGSYNFGSQEGYRQSGVVERNEWLATKDARTRDSHAAIDGEVVKLGSKFSNGLTRPGDPEGLPEEVINCRCAILAVIEE